MAAIIPVRRKTTNRASRSNYGRSQFWRMTGGHLRATVPESCSGAKKKKKLCEHVAPPPVLFVLHFRGCTPVACGCRMDSSRISPLPQELGRGLAALESPSGEDKCITGSQHEQAWDRALSRYQKIRIKLGGKPGCAHPFPKKPKGMHSRTYKRWCRLAGEAESCSWPNWVYGLVRARN